jgi:hypothetical protein
MDGATTLMSHCRAPTTLRVRWSPLVVYDHAMRVAASPPVPPPLINQSGYVREFQLNLPFHAQRHAHVASSFAEPLRTDFYQAPRSLIRLPAAAYRPRRI